MNMDFQELNDLVDDFLGGGAGITYSAVVGEITRSQESGDITDEQAANLISNLEGL